MQVIKKHFEDLCFVVVNDGNADLQQLVVFVDSRDDKELLMVRHFPFMPSQNLDLKLTNEGVEMKTTLLTWLLYFLTF